MSQPSSVTNLMVNHPICVLVLFFFIAGVITISVVTFEWIFPNDPTERDFLVWGSEQVNQYDKSLLISEALIQ